MAKVGTATGTAVTATSHRGGFASSDRGAPRAAFISQLIAERYHLAPQRVLRRAPVAEVLSTYDRSGKLAERRLPPGYRLSIEG